MTHQRSPGIDVLDEHLRLTLTEVCRICGTQEETVVEMVREGVVEPVGPRAKQWVFTGESVIRIRTTLRLQADLGVNLAGAALALELLDEIARLERRR